MVNGDILSECRCISNKDKEVLLEALNVRRDTAIKALVKVENDKRWI